MNRFTISVVATFIIAGILALSFITGAVGIHQDDSKKFTISMVISSIMTIFSIAFVITAHYVQRKKLLDESKFGYADCLYRMHDLWCLSISITITIIAAFVIIGLAIFTIEIADTTWGRWTVVPLILMHLNAGFSICWAFFPFGYIKKFTFQYVEVSVDQETPKEQTPK